MTTQETRPNPKIYKHTFGSAQYIFGILGTKGAANADDSVNGKVAHFIVGPGQRFGRYITSNPVEIALLNKEIELRHPNIFVDANESELTPEMADPLTALRARIRAEILAEEQAKVAAATNPERNMGNSEQGKLNAQSTSDVAATALGNGPALSSSLTQKLLASRTTK